MSRQRPRCPHEPKDHSPLEAWDAWMAGNLQTECPYGNCAIFVCQDCRRIVAGMGPVGCPCDQTRGWGAKFVQQMGKPAVAVKPKNGRYRWKVDRRRRETREYARWMERYRELIDLGNPQPGVGDDQ